MNHRKSIYSRLLLALAATTVMAMTTSCESVYDEGENCSYYVQFVYTMHLEEGDAFNEQVKSVDLWVFDKATGRLVDKYEESGEALAKDSYRMELHLDHDVIRNATQGFTFLAWCGDIDNKSFTVNKAGTTLEEVTASLNRQSLSGRPEASFKSTDELDLFFHGEESCVLPDWYTFDITTWQNTNVITVQKDRKEEKYECVVTIPLTRDTNNIHLTLEHLSGQFNLEQLGIEMVDNNGYMFHDNSLKEDDGNIMYLPWRVATGTLDQGEMPYGRGTDYDINDEDNKDNRYADLVTAELSTARIMANHNPVIRLYYKDTNQTVFQIPVVKWVTQMRSQNSRYAQYSDQEYLDRENNYELMVFLQDDGRGGWMAVSVVINGWHIIDNGSDNL